jgi:hypothetical protein
MRYTIAGFTLTANYDAAMFEGEGSLMTIVARSPCFATSAHAFYAETRRGFVTPHRHGMLVDSSPMNLALSRI